jgi:hypothetical protein
VGEAGAGELERYTVVELTVIADFLERGRAFQLAQAERIRGLVGDEPADGPGVGQALP